MIGAVTIAVIGCSDPATVGSTAPSRPQSGPLIPLEIGTRWSYDRVDSIEFSSDTSIRSSSHTPVSFRVIADTSTCSERRGQWWTAATVLGGLGSGHNYVANLAGGRL